MKRTFSIAMAFVGLTVGAGFATGQEVIQYFVSFGLNGIWGAVLAGIVMTIAGSVILQVGSYFLADEHRMVFRNVAHPIVSRFLDVSVTLTLFAVGFVMLAGAGSNLEQQFGLPAWAGALIMTGVVLAAGMLDVKKVSQVIGALTPLIIVAVVFAFVYTMINMPADTSHLSETAMGEASPVSPWFLSALNYNGLALLLGVSMSLVIGGNYASPKEAGLGGLMGGVLYTVMLIIAAITLYLNIETVQGSDVPMLAMMDDISPVLGVIMAIIIFFMIFNTAIGMFYALGKRLTASTDKSFRPVFVVVTLIGYGISFVGFETLMTYVYPVIGYIGMVMIAVMIAWWIRSRARIALESKRRDRIHELAHAREHEAEEYTEEDRKEMRKLVGESHIDDKTLHETITDEVKDEIPDSDLEDASADSKDATARKVTDK
ncbi:hypothetical protein ACKFRT_05120 [Corynebacterium sp. YSMAA1_1_F7]|uniref:YkvI family membrane protein n=1 Tax=Corynebacterium sp. YSMAA1_1_F7 TaxID=3383590 RepID=UPI0038D1261E